MLADNRQLCNRNDVRPEQLTVDDPLAARCGLTGSENWYKVFDLIP